MGENPMKITWRGKRYEGFLSGCTEHAVLVVGVEGFWPTVSHLEEGDV